MIIFILLACGVVFSIYSQKLAPGRYWIPFTDKSGNGFSIHSPEEFLSERAIQRRLRQNIPLLTEDLPVTKLYVDSLRKLGLTVSGTSKWFNAAIAETNDTLLLSTLNNISFIRDFTYTLPLKALALSFTPTLLPEIKENAVESSLDQNNYGLAEKQISLLNGIRLHSLGYRGKNILIAVIDAGFYNVDSYRAFDSLWLNNRIIAWHDFAQPGNPDFFRENSHGMSVLSTMGANIPGELIGTAPEASYLLLRSEITSSEYLIEEALWLLAAEYADSAGADIINSSLGYSTFQDTSMNYTNSDMNGTSAISTIAAEKAFSKGMIIVVSAGNEGAEPWKIISAPSDGKHVLAIGAIDTYLNLAAFSSVGPSADFRIKPDIVSVGYKTAITTVTGITGFGNGTSFSSPQIAGMVACLWQAIPGKTNLEIINAVRRASSRYYSPDNNFGYGIPDFYLAFRQLQSSSERIPGDGLLIIPNPAQDNFKIQLMNSEEVVRIIYVYDAFGRNVAVIKNPYLIFGYFRITELNHLQPGIYFLIVRTDKKDYPAKLIKQ